MEHFETQADQRDANDRDPIDWAIICTVIGGCSLLLGLEQKIQNRRHIEANDARLKAITGNRIRLKTISRHCKDLGRIVSRIKEIGLIKIDEEKTGITRSSIEFQSDESQESFNRLFESICNTSARLNRLLSEMDLEGFPLGAEDVVRFVKEPIAYLKDLTWSTIHPDTNPFERFNRVEKLVAEYEYFIANIDAALIG